MDLHSAASFGSYDDLLFLGEADSFRVLCVF